MKAIDLGLMAEHLITHDGMIRKLKYYYCNATHTKLREILSLQIAAMEQHVHAMLLLISPTHHSVVTIPELENLQPFTKQCPQKNGGLGDKDIAIEAHASAKFMAGENFTSALLMKNTNVKDVHFHMAYQQARLLKAYGQFIKRMGWEVVPRATYEERLHTIKNFLENVKKDK